MARLRVRSAQDFGAAVVFMAIGAAGLTFGAELEFGSTSKMGPGYFPMILSGVILALGLALGAKSLIVEGPRIERMQLRPIGVIVGTILLFGWLLTTVGLVLATFAVTIVSAYARRGVRLRESLWLGAGLTLFSVVVFVWALSQALPLWWGD